MKKEATIKKAVLFFLLFGIPFLAGCAVEEGKESIGGQGGSELIINSEKFDTGMSARAILNEPYDYTTEIVLGDGKEKVLTLTVITEWENRLQGKYSTQDLYGDAEAVDAGLMVKEDSGYENYRFAAWNEAVSGYEKGYVEVFFDEFERKIGGKVKGSFRGTLINENNLAERQEVSGTFEGRLWDAS